MSHFAPVAPIQVLEAMYEDSPHTFGCYHLLLAHHTAEYEDRFRALFQQIADDGVISPEIIMDNSVVETGGYVDFDLMMRATAVVSDYGLDVIPVLPDVMGEGIPTRAAVEADYHKWHEEMPATGFMAVCQGEDWEDFVASVELFSDRDVFPKISVLGLPRWLVKTLGTRIQAVEYAATNKETRQRIHLLGYSDDMLDDFSCSHHPGVHGIDSAVPLRYPDYFDFCVDPGKRPEDWFDTAEFNATMFTNLNFARHAHGLK